MRSLALAALRRGPGRFRRLSPAKRRLLLAALARVGLARLALWAGPLPRARALVGQLKGRARPEFSPEHLAWAVRVSSRCVPRATCLVQAVALGAMLAQNGEASQLVIGVALQENGTFGAHAWVEWQGRTLIGETASPQFQQLLVIDCPSSSQGEDGRVARRLDDPPPNAPHPADG